MSAPMASPTSVATTVTSPQEEYPTADSHPHAWRAPSSSPSAVSPDAPHSSAHTDHLNNFTAMEVNLKSRCHGFQLEGLEYDITPTGMHYLLIHYDIPKVETKSYSLKIHGAVKSQLNLDLENIRARPAITRPVTMECGGAGRVHQKFRLWQHVPWRDDAIGTSEWTGVSLADVLKECGPLDGVKSVIFTGKDKGIEAGKVQRFQRSLSLEHCMRPNEVMLVYAMNGAPLLPQHGAPLRLIVPGWLGMTNVKWLDNIELSTEEFKGHQMIAYSRARNATDEHRIPLTDMRVRAAMKPPGIPDFFNRWRFLEVGKAVTLTGRAWVGHDTIRSVEVSIDGGATWSKAETGEHLGEFAWLSWRFDWTPSKLGHVQLRCRATDSHGRTQSDQDESENNYYAMDINKPQFVDCMVVEEGKLEEGAHVPVQVMFPSL